MHSQQLPHLPGQIQRDICKLPIPSIPSLGKADGVLWMIFGNIALKGWRRPVLTGFYINRNDLGAVLYDKINFAVFVREVPGLYVKLAAELLQHIVFGEGSLKLVVWFQENGAVVQACHVFPEAGIA